MDAVGLCGSRLPHRWERRMRPLPPSTSRGRRAPCGGITQRPCPRPCRALGLCPHVSGRKSSVSPLPRWPSCCSQRVTLAPAPTWPWDVHLRPGTRIPPPLPHRYRAFALAEGAGSRAGAQRGSEGLSGAVSHLFACWPRRSLFTQGSVNADRPVGHASYLPAGMFPTCRLLLRLRSVSSPGIPSFPASSLGERSR